MKPFSRIRSTRSTIAGVAALALGVPLLFGAAPHATAADTKDHSHSHRSSGLYPTSEPDATGVHGKPRVIVTTDPEKDDQNSLIRYLLTSDAYDTEGLIVASSQYHWAGDGKGTKWFVDGREYTKFTTPDPCPCSTYRWPAGKNHIELGLDAYTKVYKNLKSHDKNYPSPQQLKSVYKVGNIDFDGEMTQDTPGSDLIKKVLLDNNPQPVYLLAWGGQSTIARALQSIQEEYQNTPQWPAIYAKVSQKAIINGSGDQDDTGAKYVKPNWPLIRQGGQGTGLGGSGGGLGYESQESASSENAHYYSADWISKNITSKGPLGALYYTWGDGRQMVKGDVTDWMWLSGYTKDQLAAMGYYMFEDPQPKGEFLGEGDTGTFLSLLDNGTRMDENTKWGRYSGGRYLPYLMNEEAVRLQWSVTPAGHKVEHAPEVSIKGPLDFTARAGQEISLSSRASDKDGNKLSYLWYEDSGIDTYPGSLSLPDTKGSSISFHVPSDVRSGQTIHLLLQVTDGGPAPLARYQRVVITVR